MVCGKCEKKLSKVRLCSALCPLRGFLSGFVCHVRLADSLDAAAGTAGAAAATARCCQTPAVLVFISVAVCDFILLTVAHLVLTNTNALCGTPGPCRLSYRTSER